MPGDSTASASTADSQTGRPQTTAISR
jgi:hypothetical protein